VHGGERRRRDGSRADLDPGIAATALDRIRAAAIDLAARNPGLRIEDKGRSLALHYRSAPEAGPRVERFAAQAIAEGDGALRAIAGKMAVEFVPHGYGKGGAIAAFLAEPPFHGRRPVFLGDDVTDEEGFSEVARRGGISPARCERRARLAGRAGRWLNQRLRGNGAPSCNVPGQATRQRGRQYGAR
jgi:trehalose 6-phosphate phosphatase